MACCSSRSPFPYIQCGICCQLVNLAEETRFLDQGNGTCRHYDAVNKSCSIYNYRPDICRVDLQFELHYSNLYTWEGFVELNLTVCRQLIAEAK